MPHQWPLELIKPVSVRKAATQTRDLAYDTVSVTYAVFVLCQSVPSEKNLKEKKDQRDPVVVYWPSVFLEAWGTKAKNHTSSGKSWFTGLAAEGGKANKLVFS